MFFDTPVYGIFLTLVVLAYWQLKRTGQNVLLLVASYIFYGWWDIRFLGLILASTIVDFFCARAIGRLQDSKKRKLLLTLSVCVNLGFLGYFKYFNFFAESFGNMAHALGLPEPAIALLLIALPPGISFYTFQELAYIVDVYQKKLEPAKSFLDYALFISLFPHLIAGPIQRPSHLLPQVQKDRHFDANVFYNGIILILSGLFRKCVIADSCAMIANRAFAGDLGVPGFASTILGVYAFAWQIYGDFSGYSDIARGSAQLMGFHFMVNFRQPYLSTSLQDFWRRWHISLSTWLRDYLYIPLGGNRSGEGSTYRNLMLTMLIGGLWHGARWTFVVWGGIHGVGLALERLLFGRGKTPEEPAGWSAWGRRIVVFHLVCGAWLFFRAANFGEAFSMIRVMGNLHWEPIHTYALIHLFCFAGPLFLLDVILEQTQEEFLFEKRHEWLRAAYAIAMMFAVTLFSASAINAFIYFQF